jgi:hypothetical protein
VQITAFLTHDDIYRYELTLSSPQKASFFKAVTLETAVGPGVTDPLVTEIEVYGIDLVQTGDIVSENSTFNQRLHFNHHLKALKTLTLTFNYAIERFDQNPDTPWNSIAGIFENIISKTLPERDEDSGISINRNYGTSAIWTAHRLLTTIARFQRNEIFDDKKDTEIRNDSYSLSFLSDPLPTLGTNLSFTRTERFRFEEKSTTSNAVLLSVDSRLYRNVNMTNDFVFTQTESFPTKSEPTTGGESTIYLMSGNLDADVTKKLFTSVQYTLSWRSTDTADSNSQSAQTFVIYRPGRLIDLNGNFKISNENGDVSTSEGISVSWVPLPAIRLIASYQHSNFEPGSTSIDSLSSLLVWHITKFLRTQLTYSYDQVKEERKTGIHSLQANVNCRF